MSCFDDVDVLSIESLVNDLDISRAQFGRFNYAVNPVDQQELALSTPHQEARRDFPILIIFSNGMTRLPTGYIAFCDTEGMVSSGQNVARRVEVRIIEFIQLVRVV
jgi:hypothetical protein